MDESRPGTTATIGYSREDLRQLRLDGLVWLAVAQYLAALAFTHLPVAADLGEHYWASVLSALVLGAVLLIRQRAPWIAAAVMIICISTTWVTVLWLFPGSTVAVSAVFVVGAASALFGPRTGLGVAVGITAIFVVDVLAGHIPMAVFLTGLLAVWLGALLFWLAARPAYTTLEWAWLSFVEAREKHEQLRQKNGELNRVIKSLDQAYRRLETLNDELNRARLAAEEARRLKSQFAASISHELRTPLNLILGFSEMIVRQRPPYGRQRLSPEFLADISAIYRNAEHLAGLVDDVLDLSQIEAGRLGLTRERAALASIIDEAIQAVRSRFDHQRLFLEVQIPPDLPPVEVDRTRIRQVVINLLNNAARFTDHGGVRITAEQRDNDIVVRVSDTGIGIPPEEIPHVFAEFYQTGSALQRRVGGSGLGLTISKRIVELHGGAMCVESTVGVGSTFCFTLPLARNIAVSFFESEIDLWNRLSQQRASDTPAVALLAAEEDTGRVLQRYLDSYRLVTFSSIAHLAAAARKQLFRGVLVAASSPEACWQALQSTLQHGIALPVISCAVPNRRQRAVTLGVADYLEKPIRRSQLKRALACLGAGVRTILVVDDSSDMVRLLSRMITSLRASYEVWPATSGEEALVILRGLRPDAVFLDLVMPDVDGYQVLEVMRSDNRLRSVPVVAISAQGAAEGAQTDVFAVGCSDGLTTNEIIHCLKACLDAFEPTRGFRSAPTPPEVPVESLASEVLLERRESEPGPAPARPSTPAPECPG